MIGIKYLLLCLVLLTAAGCSENLPAVRGEGTTDSDSDSDTDGDVDTDADSDSDTDTDIPGDCIGPGVYFDACTYMEDRCWELNPPTVATTYADAVTRCSALVLDGASDWRIPNINELQMLIVGCATPECGVSDPDCLYEYCDDSCPSCPLYSGPGPGGCYWDASIEGACSNDGYWSSSKVGSPGMHYWSVYFAAGMFMWEESEVEYSRCIRIP
jgi:hypothetical protein